MKTIPAFLIVTGLLLLLPNRGTSQDPAKQVPEIRPDLVVHEWGTFTQVVGSDGASIPWWTPYLEGPAALPAFVKSVPRISLSKGGNAWLSRMETPVLYFYADAPVRLSVEVDESKVPLTEVYPQLSNLTHPFLSAPNPGQKNPTARWDIEILPPAAAAGQSIPQVGARGAHYRHARDVPEAWLVKNVSPKAEKAEVEKFIFYRGAGHESMPISISRVNNGSVSLHASRSTRFLIQVNDKEFRWSRIAPSANDERKVALFPTKDRKAHTDQAALESVLTEELVADGLTPEEARAMVATWRESWMEETGLRLLELLPRPWIDRTLPLSISPQPAATERVFVARWEILPPALESEVLTLLEGSESIERKMAKLSQLDVGRFGTALFDRVAHLRDRQFRSTYRSEIANLLMPKTAN